MKPTEHKSLTEAEDIVSTSQEFGKDPPQAGAFHQSIWNIGHWGRSCAGEALVSTQV